MKRLIHFVRRKQPQPTQPYQEFFAFKKTLNATTAEGFDIRFRIVGRILPHKGRVFAAKNVLKDDHSDDFIDRYSADVIEPLIAPDNGHFAFRFGWTPAGEPIIGVFKLARTADGCRFQVDPCGTEFVSVANRTQFENDGCRVDLSAVEFDMNDQQVSENYSRLSAVVQAELANDPVCTALEQKRIVAALKRVQEVEAAFATNVVRRKHSGEHYTIAIQAHHRGVEVAWQFTQFWQQHCRLQGYVSEKGFPRDPLGNDLGPPLIDSHEDGSRIIPVAHATTLHFSFCLHGRVRRGRGFEPARLQRFDPVLVRVDVPAQAEYIKRIEDLIAKFDRRINERSAEKPNHRQDLLRRLTQNMDEKREVRASILRYERETQEQIAAGGFSAEQQKELLDDLKDAVNWAREEYLAK